MKHAGVIFTSVSAGKNVRDEKCKSFLREKRNVKFGDDSRPPKTERGCEKLSESETMRQGQKMAWSKFARQYNLSLVHNNKNQKVMSNAVFVLFCS